MQSRFQIGETDVAVDDQAFDLMEHRRMGLIRIAAIHPARCDDADRHAFLCHRANLHR